MKIYLPSRKIGGGSPSITIRKDGATYVNIEAANMIGEAKVVLGCKNNHLYLIEHDSGRTCSSKTRFGGFLSLSPVAHLAMKDAGLDVKGVYKYSFDMHEAEETEEGRAWRLFNPVRKELKK
jgi:hypothetical protein